MSTPDFEQRRGDRWLLVWGDLPHWMVVDDEFRRFLKSFDGARTLAEILSADADSRKTEDALVRQVRRLKELGVLTELGAVPPVAPSSGGSVRIENISVFVTRRCNLRCEFCYAMPHLRSRSEGELTGTETIRFLEAIRPHLGKNVSLNLLGGEPLLEPEKVLGLAYLAQRRSWECLVSTNGHAVTERFAAEARRAGLHVQVSLDGHAEELNDAVRGRGAFRKTLAAIERLVAAGTHTILSMVCHQGNAPHLREYYQLGLDLGANEVRFIPLKRIGGAAESTFHPVPLKELLQQAAALFREHPQFRKLAGRDCFSILAGTCRLSAKRASCGAGLQTFLLDADGSIFPCLNLHVPEMRAGNIRDRDFDFASLWRESSVLRRVRAETRMDGSRGPCAACAVRHWCLGGCHGETLAVCGELDRPAWNCAELRESVLEMLWLLADDTAVIESTSWSC